MRSRLGRVLGGMKVDGGGVSEAAGPFVVVSGCSGGGKSTLLAELARRGCAVFEEPGREIVKEQLAGGGDGLPWVDVAKFAALCIERGLAQLAEAERFGGLAFFDRSILDAFNAFEVLKLPVPARFADAVKRRRYHRQVFMTPPWPEIYANDAERRHTFADAVAEFETLQPFYARHGYEVVLLPKISPTARADFVLKRLANAT